MVSAKRFDSLQKQFIGHWQSWTNERKKNDFFFLHFNKSIHFSWFVSSNSPAGDAVCKLCKWNLVSLHLIKSRPSFVWYSQITNRNSDEQWIFFFLFFCCCNNITKNTIVHNLDWLVKTHKNAFPIAIDKNALFTSDAIQIGFSFFFFWIKRINPNANQSINYYKLRLIEDQNKEESDCHIKKPATKCNRNILQWPQVSRYSHAHNTIAWIEQNKTKANQPTIVPYIHQLM